MSRIDPALLRLVAEIVRPGYTIWDIGANVGLFSFAAAAAAGKTGQVLAIEPDSALVGLLRRSAALNRGAAVVEVLSAAVSAEMSVASFRVARRNKAASHLDGYGTTMAGGERSTVLVPTVTLDWLAGQFPVPDVLKIDVEGAEVAVLTSGPGVLGSISTIICEVAACNASAVSDLLHEHGFALYDGDRPAAERVPVPMATPNTLAMAKSVSAATLLRLQEECPSGRGALACDS
jgi:FkbM family methyltransferase